MKIYFKNVKDEKIMGGVANREDDIYAIKDDDDGKRYRSAKPLSEEAKSINFAELQSQVSETDVKWVEMNPKKINIFAD